MEKLQKFFIVLLLVGGMYHLFSRQQAKDLENSESIQTVPVVEVSSQSEEAPPIPVAPETKSVIAIKEGPTIKKISKQGDRPSNALNYVIDDGVAVVQGDVVVGEIIDDDGSSSGVVNAPTIRLWDSNTIAFYIQPTLREPERVLRALELFSNTVIHFVPYTDQEDVMVFEESSGICKSYVGKIGGKQPLWISPNCAPDDIAHEILHALGFVHEQNRTDRDHFVELFPDNIDEQYKDNFYRLPAELMKVSGLAGFDFESLMMYPPSMFSKNGQPTMQSRIKDQEIRPASGLSVKDVERINKAYGAQQRP